MTAATVGGDGLAAEVAVDEDLRWVLQGGFARLTHDVKLSPVDNRAMGYSIQFQVRDMCVCVCVCVCVYMQFQYSVQVCIRACLCVCGGGGGCVCGCGCERESVCACVCTRVHARTCGMFQC